MGERGQAATADEVSMQQQQQQHCALSPSVAELEAAVACCLPALLAALEVARLACSDVIVSHGVHWCD